MLIERPRLQIRRNCRWKLCAITWVVGTYVSVLCLISLISLTDPRIQRAYRFLNEATNAHNYAGGDVWSGNSKDGGRGARLPWCNALHWREPAGPNTALASFPGSGNTWIRYLLQQATGFYTGSVYKDYALLKNGFPAESVCNGSTVVVKTHEYGPEARRSFSRAILMIRDPFKAILAEFNRQSGGHIGHAQPNKYKIGKQWEKFAYNKALLWMNTSLDWLKFEGPLHLVFYEDLLDNLPEEMRRIFEFLDLDVDDIAFDCMMRHKDGIYKRRKRELRFNPFNPDLQKLVEEYKNVVDNAIRDFLDESSMNEHVGNLTITGIQIAEYKLPSSADIKPRR